MDISKIELPKAVVYPDSTYGSHIVIGFYALEMMDIWQKSKL